MAWVEARLVVWWGGKTSGERVGAVYASLAKVEDCDHDRRVSDDDGGVSERWVEGQLEPSETSGLFQEGSGDRRG